MDTLYSASIWDADANYYGFDLDAMFSAPSGPDHPAVVAAEATSGAMRSVQCLGTPSTDPASTSSSPHRDIQTSTLLTTSNASPSPAPHLHLTAQKATNATIANRLCAIKPAISLLNTMVYISTPNLPTRYSQFTFTALPNSTIHSTWRTHNSPIHLTTALAGEGRVSFPGVSNSIIPPLLANPAAIKSRQATLHAVKEQEYYSDVFAVSQFLEEWARGWPNKMTAKAQKLRVCVGEEGIKVFATVPSIAVGQKIEDAFEKGSTIAAAKFDKESEERERLQRYYQKEEEDEERKMLESFSGMSGKFEREIKNKKKRTREEQDDEETGQQYLTGEQVAKRVRLGPSKRGGAKA